MIVLDASAVVDLLLGTPHSGPVARALDGLGEAHAPELLDPEVLTALRRWRRREWVPPDVADRGARELGELAIVRHGHAALRARIWALRDRCSPYDACYVALAEALAATLVTSDARLGRAARGLTPVIIARAPTIEPRISPS